MTTTALVSRAGVGARATTGLVRRQALEGGVGRGGIASSAGGLAEEPTAVPAYSGTNSTRPWPAPAARARGGRRRGAGPRRSPRPPGPGRRSPPAAGPPGEVGTDATVTTSSSRATVSTRFGGGLQPARPRVTASATTAGMASTDRPRFTHSVDPLSGGSRLCGCRHSLAQVGREGNRCRGRPGRRDRGGRRTAAEEGRGHMPRAEPGPRQRRWRRTPLRPRAGAPLRPAGRPGRARPS